MRADAHSLSDMRPPRLKRILSAVLTLILAIALAAAASPAIAGEHGGGGEKGGKKAKGEAPEPEIPKSKESENLPAGAQYCAHVTDAAAQAQYAIQKKALADAQQKLERRIEALDEKTEDLKRWLQKREEFQKEAVASLVQIYAKMKPEVAAPQLLALNQITSAAILSKLPPKAASAILAEMDAPHAAKLSTILAGAAQVDEKPRAEAEPAKEGAK